MNRLSLPHALAGLAAGVAGYFLTIERYPELRLAQILMPLAWGAAAGLFLGRAHWRKAALPPAA